MLEIEKNPNLTEEEKAMMLELPVKEMSEEDCVKRQVKETHKVLDSLAETFGNTIKWTLASGAINAVTGAIRNAWNYSVKLDTSLNNIRIITDKSAVYIKKITKIIFLLFLILWHGFCKILYEKRWK